MSSLNGREKGRGDRVEDKRKARRKRTPLIQVIVKKITSESKLTVMSLGFSSLPSAPPRLLRNGKYLTHERQVAQFWPLMFVEKTTSLLCHGEPALGEASTLCDKGLLLHHGVHPASASPRVFLLCFPFSPFTNAWPC